MCGRFVQPDQGAIERAWQITPRDRIPLLPAGVRYNVTPGSYVPILRVEAGKIVLRAARWGLVPSWSGESETGQNMINARIETAAEKPAFRAAVARRRCLIPAQGWYEWQVLGAKRKQPWFIHLPQEGPMAFAAIWEQKPINALEVLETVSILTCDAAESISHIHHRMPVVLDKLHQSTWLDDVNKDGSSQAQLALEGAVLGFKAHRVSPRVSKPQNDDPDLCRPEAPQADPQRDLWDNTGP
tara:strand:+ start:4085 stop:4810 length:726 start_codon:yes stop_codon:yes gene_type:complete